MTRMTEQASLRWRRFQPKYRVFHGPLPVVALMNVTLLIMLFMVLSYQVVLQPGMMVQLPVAPFVAGAPYGGMVVTLTQEGLVFFNDDRMPMDSLGAVLHRAFQKNPVLSLTIEADARVPYDRIMRVMNMATAVGIRQVNLATRPSFGEEILP